MIRREMHEKEEGKLCRSVGLHLPKPGMWKNVYKALES